MAANLLDDLIGKFRRESDKWNRDHEALKRAPHLRPFYYRVLLTTRPFGLALCKTFEEKYLCVVLPESPSGQLGLRAGSEIISINSFAQKSEAIKILNEEYPKQKKDNFLWMYQFPKVQYLQDNAVMPITLYLKYDPLVVLSETTDQIDKKPEPEEAKQQDDKETSCNYWKILQDDVYRWAVQECAEQWMVTEPCAVYSMPPIQSPIIENNIIQYYNAQSNRKAIQDGLNGKENTVQLKAMNEFVAEDQYYKKIGQVETGMALDVYSKAGAYLEIRQPMNGWVKFKTEGKKEAKDHCIKCKTEEKEQSNEAVCEEKIEDMIHKNSKSKDEFTMYVLKDYLSGIEVSAIKPLQDEDGQYKIMDVIHACPNRPSIVYLMGDIDFGSTFDTQQAHLKELVKLRNAYRHEANFVIVRVCCVNHVIQSKKVAQKLKIENVELECDLFIYGRARMEILKTFGLLHYDTGFFKYGLMVLSKENKIVIHPKELINASVFNKIAAYIRSDQ
eukprot:1127798_1